MFRTFIASAALIAALPLSAQSPQDALGDRYDRALAAGYKALFLCSAIANAERNGTTRTPESVAQWELTGIQSPLVDIISELPFELHRVPTANPAGSKPQLGSVSVRWDAAMAPRIAVHNSQHGCSLLPIGGKRAPIAATRQQIPQPVASTASPTDPALAAVLGNSFGASYGEGTRTTAALVVENEDLRGERYADGFDPATPQRTWSVAKSLAATIVGAAVHRGQARVEDSAGLHLFFNDGRRAITIDHLLRMASGRYSDTAGNRTDPLYWGGATVDERAASWPLLHQPGTVFRYANNDTLMAIEAISETFEKHPPAEFFARLGMDHTVAETDWRGDYILSSQVWSTARDLARFGQLYLDDGVLPDGERILPEGWVQYVSASSGPQPEGRPVGYGAGFWLLNSAPGIPPDTFAAFGNRGQYVVIVPSRDVVIVRRGEDPVGSRFDIAAFTSDILAALE